MLRRDDLAVTMALDTPANTAAMVGVPREYFEIGEVTANGRTIWANGSPADPAVSASQNIRFAGADDKYLKFEVGSGNWQFSAVSKAAQ